MIPCFAASLAASCWPHREREIVIMCFRVHVLIGLLALSVAASAQEPRTAAQQSAPLHRIDPRTPEGLQSVFNHASGPLPLVSAHRGGAGRNYPENCIATFENTLRHTFALLEIDPRVARDGKIILHHDATLDRTTTGTGRVADLTLAELQQLRLRDTEGKVTEFQIPTLDEALEWARGKTVLVLDQKDVPLAARVKKIEEHKAEAYAMLIVYSYADAKACFCAQSKHHDGSHGPQPGQARRIRAHRRSLA
jgi:glycerophosphoryl diester phosphodiesterase